ncbi:MAG TPA: M48 family metallopeptidase [Gemmatales bacterium]|nr:M48 family metallopeptidase [Gemmatales bacterium]
MAMVTFRDQIAANKRASFWLVLFFILFTAALAVILAIAFLSMSTGRATWNEIQSGSMIGIIAAVIALVFCFFAYFTGDSLVLGVSGAQEIQQPDDPELFNVVEEMSIAAGVPMPKVYLMHDAALNAFATGRDPQHGIVAITTGLRQRLTRDELQGVLAHEMGHIRNFDIRLMLLLAVLIGVIVMLSDFFWRAMRSGAFWGSNSRGSSGSSSSSGGKKDGAGLIIAILIIVAFILSILAPILAQIIQLAVSRKREFMADASAVEFTRNPQGLIDALKKLSDDNRPLVAANRGTAHMFIVNPIRKFSERSSTMFSSHPPIEERIRQLELLMQ